MPSSCTGYCLRNHLSLKTFILVKMHGLIKEYYLEPFNIHYLAEGIFISKLSWEILFQPGLCASPAM